MRWWLIPPRQLSHIEINLELIIYSNSHSKWSTQVMSVLTLASSIAFLGIWTLGNAYKAPVTSLHVIPSREFNTEVVMLAFLWYEAKMAIFSYEMKVGIGNINLTENNSLVSCIEEFMKESTLTHKDPRSQTAEHLKCLIRRFYGLANNTPRCVRVTSIHPIE